MPRGIYKHKPQTEAHKNAIRQSLKGRKITWADKIGKSNKGNIPWHKGRTGVYSKETIKAISESKKGDKNPMKRLEVRKKVSDSINEGYANGRIAPWKGKNIKPGMGFQKGEHSVNWNPNKIRIIPTRLKPEKCEICGNSVRICLDHDHKTGKFRGWICHNCNTALGHAKDNIETLQGLINYLKQNA